MGYLGLGNGRPRRSVDYVRPEGGERINWTLTVKFFNMRPLILAIFKPNPIAFSVFIILVLFKRHLIEKLFVDLLRFQSGSIRV